MKFQPDTLVGVNMIQRHDPGRIVVGGTARVAGLSSLSATVAAQLMEENRAFRQRWLKVAQ